MGSRRSELTTKVFVGSLPPNVTADDLKGLFAPYGAIAECDIANRCGFLHLEDKDLALKAIAELNNTTFMGGRISVEKGRVKPRGDRRMRSNPRGGGMGGRKRDMGPYSRDQGYAMPRNGNFPRNDFGGNDGGGGVVGGGGYDEYRNEYQRSGYEDTYDRRPMYDDRRGGGYMNERRGYNNNGYDRRPYQEDRPPYQETQRSGYDERMPPSISSGYGDRRPPPMGDRRPLIDDQSMGQQPPRQAVNTYDRTPQVSNDMYSRRDPVLKPLSSSYDRVGQTTYGSYSNTTPSTGGYGMQTTNTGYNASSYSQPVQNTGYGDGRGQTTTYMENRSQATPSTGSYGSAQTYNNLQTGGYGDNYGVRAPTNTYDSAYPPLPQQRGW